MALQVNGQLIQGLPNQRATAAQPFLQAQLGELCVSEVLPRYAALAWSGLVFFAANTAAQALSVNSTTFTGLGVGNPASSGKNLVILEVVMGIAAVVAAVGTPRLGYAATVALTTGSSTGPKGLPTLVGTSGSSTATVGASATLGAAPTTLRPIMAVTWVTAGTSTAMVYAKDEVAGSIIIPPGQMLTLDALVAAETVVAAVTWAELPI